MDKKNYRILVIEDNPGDYIIVEDFLTEQLVDPEIVHAVNFQQAAALLCAGTAFDIILLDLSLPDKSGQNLVTEMLRLASLSPIIILSGFTDIDFSIRSISQGILDYLVKDEMNAAALYKSMLYAIERKRAISDLVESEKRYSDLFHLSPQPMWVFDPKTLRFLQVNKAACVLYGYSEEEFLCMTIQVLVAGSDILLSETGSVDGDIFSGRNHHHRKKNGEMIQVEMQETIILYKEKKACIVVAADITEKMKFIDTIQDQNKKLREIAWMQSHVVRAPVARIMMLADIIKNDNPYNMDKDELLDSLVNSANELDGVIRDIAIKITT